MDNIAILATIRVATALYVLSVALWLTRRDAAARVTWTLACAFYLAHVVTAFQFHHHWSHRAAYQETAQQTAAVFGLNWGGGLYFNYAFTLVWVADAFWWWRAGLDGYRARASWVTGTLHWFFAFMFFNAAIVFGSGLIRWFGVAAILILVTIAARQASRSRVKSLQMKSCWLVLTFSATLLSVRSMNAQDGATHADWPSYGGTDLAWRYSALDQITAANVKKLAPVWMFQTGDYDQGLQSTPIVIDGVLYLSTTHSNVFALDAATGKLIWQFKYPLPRGAGGNIQNRGLAVGAGKVFVGTYDDYVVAIDQKTGVESWKTAMNDSRQCGCSITAAPLFVKDKVIVGVAGGDGAFRGYLTALDAKTGRVAWRFYTIPRPGEKGNETWKGDSWKYGGGATWMTGSFDAALNLVYWGTGNAASDMYAENRYSGQGEGSNLYTSSVVALDADTGKLKWYYQEIPKDVWDYDAAYECLLIDREVRGVMRKLLVHINKSGYAWVLDRTNGKFLGAYPIVDYHNWLTGITEDGKILGRLEPVEGKTTLICPGPDGGKSWNQVAFSPRTGLMYTPTLEICSDSISREQEPVEGRGFIGGTWSHRAPKDGPAYSHIDAYDPVSGKRVWSMRYQYVLLASMLATGGDLVFTGDPEGNFFALNARTGAKLWNFQTGGGHRGSAVSYSVKGRQYIATPTGWGSIAGRAMVSIWPEAETFRPGSTLMVFALPEGGQ